MAVAFDAKTATWKSVNGVATMDVTNLTVGAGSNRALLVMILFSDGVQPAGQTVTWDATGTPQPCTLIPGTQNQSGAMTCATALYGLINPTSGNKTLRISWTGNLEAHACAIAFTGVDQTSVAVAFPNGATHFVNGASPATVTVNSATGDMAAACHANTFSGWGAISGTTLATDSGTGPNLAIASNYANGAAPNVAMTAAFTGTGTNMSAGCDILAAGGGAITGTLAATEAGDTAAISGTVTLTPVTGTLAATEAGDTARFFEPIVTGTLASTEAGDSAAFAGGSGGTPTLIWTVGSTTSDNNGIAVNGVQFNGPNNTLAGNSLILAIGYPYSASRTVSINDSAGDVWPAPAIVQGTAANGNMRTAIYVLPNASAALHQLTLTFDAAVRPFSYSLSEFNNVALVSPLDGTKGANAVAGSAANAGSFTPTTNNDASGGHLIFQYAISNDTVGTGSATRASAMSATNGAKLLHADNSGTIPSASAYLVQGANAAINPGFAITQSTGTNFVVSAVALKAAMAGAAPAAGIRIIRVLHFSLTPGSSGVKTYLFPVDGNLRVLTMAAGSDLNPVPSVTDSDGHTYSPRAAASQSQIFDFGNTTANNALTLSFDAGANQFSGHLWDIIGADPTPFMNASGIYKSNPSSGAVVNDLPDHTPNANVKGLTIAQTGMGTAGPVSIIPPSSFFAPGAPAGATPDIIYYTGMSDADLFDNADPFGHVSFNDNTPQTWNWGMGVAGRGSTAFATAASYKQATTTSTGTLASTEAADTAAFAGSLNVFGPLASSEAGDTAAVTGNVVWLATLAASETGDAAAFTAAIIGTGTLAATEGSDVSAITAGIVATGDFAATEAADAAAFTGAVVVAGTLAASEAADTAAFTTDVVATGTLAATEARDTAAFTGSVFSGLIAILNASEAADAAAFAGQVTGIAGILDALGGADTASFAGAVLPLSTGNFAATEAADIAAFAGSVISAAAIGALAATEAPDTARFASGKVIETVSLIGQRTGPAEFIAQRTAPASWKAQA
jgi:trimeric autotransporter adhesin